MASAFCARRSTTICPVRTTFTFRRRKYVNSICRTGDTVSGQVRPPKDGERYFALIKVEAVNFEDPEVARNKIFFDNLTPLYPQERIRLETTKENLTGRVLDMLCPVGKGQRGLIVAPPRTGKTMMLQSIANSITANHPEVALIVLLIDEQPGRSDRHAAHGEGRGDQARPSTSRPNGASKWRKWCSRRPSGVEHKRDVVILLDSLTRLGRAYNAVTPLQARCFPAVSTRTPCSVRGDFLSPRAKH